MAVETETIVLDEIDLRSLLPDDLGGECALCSGETYSAEKYDDLCDSCRKSLLWGT